MVTRFLRFLLAAFLLCSGVSVLASADINIDISGQELDRLSKDTYWLTLLHYEQRGGNRFVSSIKTNAFFASKQGSSSPKEELKANLAAMLEPVSENSNIHQICRFPERFYWLREQIPALGISAPKPSCDAYEHWKENKSIDNVSVIFATGYLGNPASFYGHLLMKFGSEASSDIQSHDLLDKSINYGANVPENENGLVYMFKGVFGGYAAGFTPALYYENTQVYSDIELRDVWEYRLNLSSDEAAQLLRHSWELLGQEFTYYYIHENCGYRIAELLSLILDEPLQHKSGNWTIPISIISRLTSYRHGGMPLVRDISRHVSRQNRFYEKHVQLDELQKKAVEKLSKLPIDYSKQAYLYLDETQKIQVVDTLLDYYELRVKNDYSEQVAEAKRQSLLEMFRLTKNTRLPDWKEKTVPSPEQGNLPGLLRVGAARSEGDTSAELNWRLAYFDMLNLDAGTMPYSKLSMIDLRLEVSESKLKFKHLDLLDIDTLSLPSTGLDGDKRFSWALNVGVGSTDNSCDDCDAIYVKGEWGVAKEIFDTAAIYARVIGQVQNEAKTTSSIQAGGHLGLVLSVTDWWRIKIDYEERYGLGGSVDNSSNDEFRMTRVEQRFGNSSQWDVRMRYENNVSEEYALSFGYYF